MKISWGNNCGIDNMANHNGYGYATERIVNSLRSLGYSVDYNDKSADVHLHFDQPHHLVRPRKDIYTISYLPWESTRLKSGWSDIMNQCDEIWTPSPLIADWYRRAGVTPPVHVFEHGVDALWSPKKREWSGDTFNILHVGAEASRRAGKEAMQSLRLAFPRETDVKLNMKIMSAGWNIGQLPRIDIINKKLSIQELLDLYYDNHLMLGISYGEGFGLTPLQGLATGMPVISQPDWAPYGDRLDPDLSISSKLVKSPWPAIHPGEMLKPNMDELIDRLRFAYNNFEKVSEFAVNNAASVKQYYQWDSLTKTAFEDLEKRLKNL